MTNLTLVVLEPTLLKQMNTLLVEVNNSIYCTTSHSEIADKSEILGIMAETAYCHSRYMTVEYLM